MSNNKIDQRADQAACRSVAMAVNRSHERKCPTLKTLVIFKLFATLITILQVISRNQLALAAPPPSIDTTSQQDAHMQQRRLIPSPEPGVVDKGADLTMLINETLTINNKTLASERQNVKDDWTFDMVEYDLMEFLQDLSARYRLANGNKTLSDEDYAALASNYPANLDGRKSVAKKQPIMDNDEMQSQARDSPPKQVSQTSSDPHGPPMMADDKDAKIQDNKTHEPRKSSSSTAVPELPPVSLASGDHDIAESTWQYGIFDRFTRPRASTTSTTASPSLDSIQSHSSGLAGPSTRNYNSEECGLRTYDHETNYYPPTGLEEHETASKELNQRRQKIPGGSFFSSHKKFQAPPDLAEELSDDERLMSELDRRQPSTLNGYGQSSSSSVAEGNMENGGDATDKNKWAGPVENLADTEFNLSSRRHWLQQQLGQTLQMLGFNSTNAPSDISFGRSSSLEDFLNETSKASGGGVSFRENMMKKSSKTSKSLIDVPLVESSLKSLKAGPTDSMDQLMTRQDELKLEARVIGGSDARLGDSPWSVSLQALVSRPGTGGVEYRHYCGGTIISEYYILTAAHCLDFMVGRESRLFVVIGDLNWRMSAASLHGRRFGVEKLIIHSGYKSTAFGHDIGLIRTKESMKPMKVNGRYIVNSVCLPEKGVEHSGEAELVGWGLFSNRNEMADSLQIADVPILPRPLCVDLYKRRTGLIQWLIGIELITDKQVCAGTFGRGICQGDSGSALVFNEKVSRLHLNQESPSTIEGKASNQRHRTNLARDQQTQATIIGTVAFGGIRRCSYQSLPGVYMQTSKYMDWILPRIQS